MLDHDLIIVPGGGLRPDGELPPYVVARLQRALDLYNGQPILLLSAGTTHKPQPHDAQGRPIYESVAAAHYLAGRGVPTAQLFVETSSYDTIGNAFYARVLHTELRPWRRLLIVNSDFHMPRTKAAFGWIFSLDPGPTPYTLNYEVTPDTGIPEPALNSRRQKEAASLHSLQSLTQTLRSLAAVHDWLNHHHDAYAWHRKPESPSGFNQYSDTY